MWLKNGKKMRFFEDDLKLYWFFLFRKWLVVRQTSGEICGQVRFSLSKQYARDNHGGYFKTTKICLSKSPITKKHVWKHEGNLQPVYVLKYNCFRKVFFREQARVYSL